MRANDQADGASESTGVSGGSAEGRARLILDSRELFDGRNEIGIVHAGEVYRLRITRQGKLILNK